MERDRSLQMAAAVGLIVAQVVHGYIPAETSSDTSVGFYAGLVLLAASAVALAGLTMHRDWGRKLLGLVGGVVAVGFLLYHALPVYSPVTNPYFGEEGIGFAQWAPVIAAMAIGVWCVVATRRKADVGSVSA